jgi:hypothetical protein
MRVLAVVFMMLTAVYGIRPTSALAVSPDDNPDEAAWDVEDEPMDEPLDAPDYEATYPGSYDDDELSGEAPDYPDDPPAEDDIRE